jgi:hypothetical protein
MRFLKSWFMLFWWNRSKLPQENTKIELSAILLYEVVQYIPLTLRSGSRNRKVLKNGMHND